MTAKLKTKLLVVLAFVFAVLLATVEIFKGFIFDGIDYGDNIYMIVSRILGALACLIFVYMYSSKKILSFKTTLKAFLIFLPCMAVAINNFPFITFFGGKAYIDEEPAGIIIYAAVCVSVGLFEEMAFRGCIFMAVLGRKGKRTVDVFWAIVISSVIFGIVHLLNIIAGAGIGSVVLQVGYSFLIGGMCSVILVKTANIWYCVILHAVYNFAGGVVPECGGGVIWDTPTVILTAVVAVAVAVYVVYMLFKIKPEDIDKLLDK